MGHTPPEKVPGVARNTQEEEEPVKELVKAIEELALEHPDEWTLGWHDHLDMNRFDHASGISMYEDGDISSGRTDDTPQVVGLGWWLARRIRKVFTTLQETQALRRILRHERPKPEVLNRPYWPDILIGELTP